MLSIVVPMYNEADNVRPLYQALTNTFRAIPYEFEMLFVDDGSRDDTVERLRELAMEDERVRPVELARNFGKEIALSAGLHATKGEAAIMIDADLQHPPDLIPRFIKKWEEGADLVIGVRKSYKTSWLKRCCSDLFYKIISRTSDTDLVPHATDFRLVDRQVINAFNGFTERNRITRGLFDWLGYKRHLVYFDTSERQNGQASYSFFKLFKLAKDSLIGHTIFPLWVASYLGVIITAISIPLGIFILLDRYVFMNTFGFSFSGSAILAVINLFLSGIVLSCLGLVSLYLANIHTEVTNRPLYVRRPEARKVSYDNEAKSLSAASRPANPETANHQVRRDRRLEPAAARRKLKRHSLQSHTLEGMKLFKGGAN